MINITTAIMEKLELRIDQNDLLADDNGVPNENFQDLMNLKRRYTCAYISDQYPFKNYERTWVKKARCLAVYHQPSSYPQIMKFFDHWPELEQLTMETMCKDKSVVPVTLRKLKKLTVIGDSSALRLIQAPELVLLNVERCYVMVGIESFESFLKAAPKLEILRIESLAAFRSITADFSFKLKEIRCENIFAFAPLLNQNLKKFISSQAKSLEKLVAFCEDSEFHEIVLTKCKRLRILETNLEKLNASEEFCKSLEPMASLREINSIHGFSSENAFRSVLGNCPRLVRLQLFNNDFLPKMLHFAADHCRHLTSLKIRKIASANAKFQNLKDLTLWEVGDAENVTSFLKANPSIENLGIILLKEGRLNSKSFDILINETGLKHVHIWSGESAIDEVFEKIKKGFGNLKTLKLGARYDFVFP